MAGGGITAPDPRAAIRRWLAAYERYCAVQDYDGAAALFGEDAASFGPQMDIAAGPDALRANQWQPVWGSIRNFKIDIDGAQAGGGGGFAWGAATWTSIGFDGKHNPFYRPGRMSVALRRRGGTWVATMIHCSLHPGIPHRTFGPRARGDG